MFIRTKNIKGADYAYFVRNFWRKRKKGSRQKVSKYLGRVYRFNVINNKSFFDLIKISNIAKYIENKGRVGVIKDLIEGELMNRGFNIEGKFLVNNLLYFDMETFSFLKDNKKDSRILKAVIEMNEGFLCKETISKIVNFKQGSEEREGYNLASVFLEAGLNIPEEVFVEYYRRFYGS